LFDPDLAIARNAYRGPAAYNVDVSVSKSVAFTDRIALCLKGNACNAFNRALDPRQVQLGAKLTF